LASTTPKFFIKTSAKLRAGRRKLGGKSYALTNTSIADQPLPIVQKLRDAQNGSSQ
jgi:hypothetical protein